MKPSSNLALLLVTTSFVVNCGGRSVLDDGPGRADDPRMGADGSWIEDSMGNRVLVPGRSDPPPMTTSSASPGQPGSAGSATGGAQTGSSPTPSAQTASPTSAPATSGSATAEPDTTASAATSTAAMTGAPIPPPVAAPTSSPTVIFTPPLPPPPVMTTGPATVVPPTSTPFEVPPEWDDLGFVDPYSDACSVDYLQNYSDGCYLQFQCDNQWNYSQCWQDGFSTWYCSCQGANGSSQLSLPLDSVSSDNACRVAGAVCATDFPPDAVEQTCWESSSSYSRNYCQLQTECGNTISLGETSVLETTSSQYSYCYWDDNGSASCSCYGSAGSIYVKMQEQGNETCRVVSDVCDHGIETDSLGPIECEVDYEGTRKDQCEINYACTQEASSAGVPVSLSGQSGSYCYLMPDGQWQCWCSNSNREFNMQGDEPRTVCKTAGEQCLADLTDLTSGAFKGAFTDGSIPLR